MKRRESLFCDVKEAARVIGCSERAVRARVARQVIPCRRLGKRVLFLRAELEQFLAGLPGVTLDEARRNQEARNA